MYADTFIDIFQGDESSPVNSRPASFTPAENEHVVKYFGSIPVEIGTGIETIEHAASVSDYFL